VKICSIKGCNNKHYGKSLCRKHWSKQYQKRYYQNNKDHYAKWRQDNKEYIKRENKRYRKEHKEYYIRINKQYCLDNKERKAEYNKKYNQTPIGKAMLKVRKHKRRALLKGLTKETIQRVYEDNLKKYGTLTCILCNKPIAFGKDSLEHLTPVSRGGSNDYENLGVAHLNCNHKKHTKTLEEWFNYFGKE